MAKTKLVELLKQESLSQLEHDILKILKKSKKGLSLQQLSDNLDRSLLSIHGATARLKDKGYNLKVTGTTAFSQLALVPEVEPGAGEPLIIHTPARWKGKQYKFGACGDKHYGSKHCREDVVRSLYDLYEDEGITEVFDTGNWLEGEMRLNRHDIKVFGLDAQIDYVIQNHPQKKGLTTYFVAGDDHEGWYQRNESLEIGRYLQLRAEESGRYDLKYLGFVEADVILRSKGGQRLMRVMHPGGGASYALSYASQKIIESLQGGEKPAILLYGHYHKFDVNYYREVWSVCTGTCCDQTIFMRKQKIQAHVGGCIIDLNQDQANGAITRFKVEWLPFYDKGFYTNPRQFGIPVEPLLR